MLLFSLQSEVTWRNRVKADSRLWTKSSEVSAGSQGPVDPRPFDLSIVQRAVAACFVYGPSQLSKLGVSSIGTSFRPVNFILSVCLQVGSITKDHE